MNIIANMTVALQSSSWKTISVALKFVHDDDDELQLVRLRLIKIALCNNRNRAVPVHFFAGSSFPVSHVKNLDFRFRFFPVLCSNANFQVFSWLRLHTENAERR